MTSTVHRAAVASALLLAIGSVPAQEPRAWGPYVAAEVGATRFDPGEVKPDGWSGFPSGTPDLDRSDIAYSLAAGFRFSPYFAVEAAYLDLGRSSYRVGADGAAAALGFESKGAALSLMGAWPIDRTWSLEGRAGVYFGASKLRGWASAVLEFDPDGDVDVLLEGSGGADAGWLLGAGVVASSGRHWAVRLGYDFLSLPAGTAHVAGNSAAAAGARMDSRAGRVSLGIRYLF